MSKQKLNYIMLDELEELEEKFFKTQEVDELHIDKDWTLQKHGHGLYTAYKHDDTDRYIFFSRHVLERYFGKVVFPSEQS